MDVYGPVEKETYQITNPLNTFIDLCVTYVAGLPDFDKYCLWRITVGSATINHLLIFNELSPNSVYWIYLFFKFYKNTFHSTFNLPSSFIKWKHYFSDPDYFLQLPQSSQLSIIREIIPEYIVTLET